MAVQILCDGGGGGNRTRVLKPRGQGIYARILRFGFARPDSHRQDSDPASSLGLSRPSRSEERRSSRLLTPNPRPPARRDERRYLVKQRKRAVYRRVCAVQLFNEDLDHLGAPPCFCLLSRDLSPPFCVVPEPTIQQPARLRSIIPRAQGSPSGGTTGGARRAAAAGSVRPGSARCGARHPARRCDHACRRDGAPAPRPARSWPPPGGSTSAAG
jgi:hypothetical protein